MRDRACVTIVYGECVHTADFHAKVGNTTISFTGYLGSNLGNETDCPVTIFMSFCVFPLSK